MKTTRAVWLAILILIVWLVLSWFLGEWIGVKPPVLLYLRIGLAFIGIVGFIGFLFLRPNTQNAAPDQAADTAAEIDFNFTEASRRIQTATGYKQIGSLPAVFVIGDTGSAKTSIIAKSGLDPELLAGRAFEEVSVVPTRSVNLWYSRHTLLIDPAGGVLEDAGIRRKLFKRFLPVRLNAVLAAKFPPTRAAVFTVDCGTILQAGGAEAMAAKARHFHTILGELSQELGSSFPVYVLFTKADQIPYFRDYVETFTEGEASEIFGATLPILPDSGRGVYAEQQTRRITDAFQTLYYSLCDARPTFLGREHDAAKLPNIYEFAREFSKLRPLLVQFLLDLCRPSQLGTSPFLRGFYFTGVRPVTVADLMPAAQVAAVEEETFDPGATRIFGKRSAAGRMHADVREAGSRKIPQWVFLPHLFSTIILADRSATTITQRNVKINVARRILLGTVAAVAALLAVWWFVSYRNNSELIRQGVEAASAVPPGNQPSGELAPLDSLQRLTRIKDRLAVLDNHAKNGAPLTYRAFLYTGNDIREPLEMTYYALFRKLLLAPTQQVLSAVCGKPDAYGAKGYGYIYDALKAYLITTDHHDKSTPQFLTPALTTYWQQNQQADAPRQDLARQNFDFYADRLATANPYPRFATPDAEIVDSARAYLNKQAPEERIYYAMLDSAKGNQKTINFNADYPGSRETIINGYLVNPAFSKTGYRNFVKQLQNPDKYLYGEKWVLGEQAPPNYDRASVLQAITAQYNNDFVKTWSAYLNATAVAPYGNVPDAAKKLGIMSSPQSTLLQVFCVASENTSVPNKDLAGAFQPVQSVTPTGCTQQLIAPSNQPYMQSLLQLQLALQTVGPIANADPNNVTNANTATTQADNAVGTLAFKFAPNSPVVSKATDILHAPIRGVAPLLKGAGAGPVNAAAGGMCATVQPILNKYPFNPKSQQDATLDEVNSFLNPQTGSLWQLYNGSLKQFLILSGTDYIPATGQQLAVTQPFLRFFNRAARLSRALYATNSAPPGFTFPAQVLPSPDVTQVTLTINGQVLSTDLKSGAKSQIFNWPGQTPGVSLGVAFGGGAEGVVYQTSSPWGIWRFLDTAERPVLTGNQIAVEWVQRTSAGPIMYSGHPEAVKFAFDSPVLRPQYFGGLSCVSKAIE
ncbi:MAG: hypothetical protein JO033_06865 [Acidobacteriaceae bacterium]|nr:hypothetical protein [Acidobacteriaceae bacterium]MBV9500662.1 hypothetical protein [Acidobacteriaceae bacterium]